MCRLHILDALHLQSLQARLGTPELIRPVFDFVFHSFELVLRQGASSSLLRLSMLCHQIDTVGAGRSELAHVVILRAVALKRIASCVLRERRRYGPIHWIT